MHAAALKKIARQVEGILKQCRVANSWPEYASIEVHISSLAQEILKHKGQWLSNLDVWSIYYDLVYVAIREGRAPDEKISGGLWDLLGEERANRLKADLVAFYESIPRPYEVFVPLHSTTVTFPPVRLTDRFAIELFDDPMQARAGTLGGLLGLAAAKPNPPQPYFRYRTEGYCGGNLQSATVSEALSSFKIAYQQLIAKDLFTMVQGPPSGFGFLSGITHFQIEKVHLLSVDRSPGVSLTVRTELPLHVSGLITSLELNASHERVSAAITDRQLAELLNAYLHLPSLLIESSELEATRVKSAIQWCFDSYAAQNDTMAFLQTCFGLEALFGDETSSETLTQTLADRCAYLVASDVKGRPTIRDRFKDLYKIRSKLVHGGRAALSPEEAYYLIWGRDVLEYAIFKEMKHLRLE